MKVKEADLSVSFPLPSFSGPHAGLCHPGQWQDTARSVWNFLDLKTTFYVALGKKRPRQKEIIFRMNGL